MIESTEKNDEELAKLVRAIRDMNDQEAVRVLKGISAQTALHVVTMSYRLCGKKVGNRLRNYIGTGK